MNDGGYVKLWRKSISGGWLSNHTLWAFWCYCLMKATHKPCKLLIGYREVFLEPGQFIFGRKKCAKELKTSERSVRTCLHTLKTTNNIAIKTTNKFSIVSIINWDIYQQDDRKNGHQNDHQNDQQVTSKRPTSDHIQECKECKEKDSTSVCTDEKVPYSEIMKLYNNKCQDMPTCKFMTEKRRKQIKQCWNQEPGRTDSIEFWAEFFDFMQESKFLTGKTPKPFTGCSLEWATKLSNFIKIREGTYNRD